MHHGQNGSKANNVNKALKMLIDRKQGGEFINFVEIGAICIIDLGGMDAPAFEFTRVITVASMITSSVAQSVKRVGQHCFRRYVMVCMVHWSGNSLTC